jgi:F0F1-type ATP synthase assembly protein I
VPDESFGWPTLLGMGAVIAVELLVGLGLGWLVDKLLGTGPVFLLIGLVLGVVGAVCYTVVEFRKYLKT